MTAFRVYNNIFTLKVPLEWGDNFLGSGYLFGTNNIVANNTLISWHTNITGGGVYYPHEQQIAVGQNCTVVNNLIVDGTPGIFLYGQTVTNCLGNQFGTTNQQYVAGFYSGYNVYASGAAPQFYVGVYSCFGTSGGLGNFTSYFPTYSQWQAFGFDANSTTNAPTFSTNWVPAFGDTVCNGKGTNLTAYGITKDYFGNALPATGAWPIGYAMASGSASGVVSIVGASSGVSIQGGSTGVQIIGQ
jgi:hypothetical protein